jgi:hypothetical protein
VQKLQLNWHTNLCLNERGLSRLGSPWGRLTTIIKKNPSQIHWVKSHAWSSSFQPRRMM